MAVNSFNAQNPPVTTKGDVFTFSTIPTRLGVGANDTVLTADSSTSTGLKWATPTATNASWTQVATGSTTSGTGFSITGLSGYDKYYLSWAYAALSGNGTIICRLNANSGSVYYTFLARAYNGAGFYGTSSNTGGRDTAMGTTGFLWGDTTASSGQNEHLNILITGATSTTGYKHFEMMGYGLAATNTNNLSWANGIFESNSAVTSIDITFGSSRTATAGNYILWGSN